MNSIAKEDNFSNNGAREVKFVLIDGGEDGKHTGVGCMAKPKNYLRRSMH